MSPQTEVYLWPGGESSAQTLLSESPDLAVGDTGHTEHGGGLWESSLAIPIVLSVASLSTLLIRYTLARASSSTKGERDGIAGGHAHRPSTKAGPRERGVARGGVAILRYRLLRVVTCLALVLLNAFTFVDRIQVGVLGTYVYGSLLAVAATSARPGIAKLANTHATWNLFGTWVVYVWRDVYPLGTFTFQPLDIEEGWLMWTNFGLLSVAAVFVPLFVPTEYIPLDPEGTQLEPIKEQTASWASFASYSFLDEFIRKASNVSHLPAEEFPPLADYDFGSNLMRKSFPYLDPQSGRFRGNLLWGLMRVFRKEYVIICALLAARAILSFLSLVSINRLLTYLGDGGKDAVVRPWVWILFLFFGPVVGSIMHEGYIFVIGRAYCQCQAIMSQLVFEHALKMRVKAEPSPTKTSSTKDEGKESTHLTGKMTNLMTADLNDLIDGRDFPLILVYFPIQVVGCTWFLYKILGWSAIVGMMAIVVLSPVPRYLAVKLQIVQRGKMKKTDARVQAVTEVMNVIRMVKIFGWENKMDDRVSNLREEELVYQRKRLLLQAFSKIVNFFIPVLTMVVSFACYTLVMKEELTAATVFSAMSVFDILRNQMNMVIGLIPRIIRSKITVDRFNDFLCNTELLDAFDPARENATVDSDRPGTSSFIGIRNASFTWSSESTGVVALGSSRRNFNLRIEDEVVFKQGKINLIVGPTGCGKTSLLMALLGELHYIPSGPDSWFNLPRENGVAYAAQESWVQNETIRDNILFGSEFDETRYRNVIHQCGLNRDLTLFEAGDKTEVGEKGLTLSGGQKARVTLARAVYSRAQVLILDDILAALDVHTAKWIVEKCLKGDLVRGRTVLLVTHNIALAGPVADFIVSLGHDGRILSQGTLSEVLKSNKALLSETNAEREGVAEVSKTADGVLPEIHQGKGGKLIAAEEIAEGHVGFQALKMYLIGMGGISSALFWVAVILYWGLAEALLAFQTWYLGYWASQYEKRPPSDVSPLRYLLVYSSLLVAATCLNGFATITYAFGSLRASRVLHRGLISSVLSTTFRWLDSTPVARVISRCTQDIQAVDTIVSDTLGNLIGLSLSMSAKFVAVLTFSPIFSVPGIVVLMVGGWTGQMYIKAQLSVKREMSNARSPVLSHLSGSVAGIVSVRAYSAEEAFKKESLRRIDNHTRPSRMFYNLNRWINVRGDAIGAAFSSGLAAYLVYGTGAIGKPGSAANVGFSLNMGAGFSGLILWWVRSLNSFEIASNSLERIHEYTKIEQEPKPIPEGVPPAYWPASGELVVESLSAKYSADGPEILHGLNFRIKAGERVGVVGRTGSGKSSLTLALLRCILTDGDIIFDGIPTSKINLDSLRTNITIIPQVPELLSDTLRGNLDPFGQYDNATLNDALRSAGLFSVQNKDDQGRITLETAISSGGGNLSIGQRQILALARAIVRRSKLLILDEATSAIDYETDKVIQNSLRTNLGSDVTLFTVAHRLQTIMDADKIMVLDAGNIVEFGKPTELLQIEGGRLKGLVDESGDKDALYKMAQ